MRLGQTSVVHFLSRTVASLLGFVATVYIAQLLGAGALGVYATVMAVVSWLGLLGTMGISSATSKRVSEGEEDGAYAIAATLLVLSIFAVLAVLLYVFGDAVDAYVGADTSEFAILLLFVTLCYSLVSSVLTGQHLVHVAGILSPVNAGTRSILQIWALVVGAGLAGLFYGYALGSLVVIVVGTVLIARSLDSISMPDRRHFSELFSFAKYSWLGGLKSKAFNWVDIAVLAVFVPSGLIGIYSAAWNISQFLLLFSGSIGQAMFPEMSQLSTEEGAEAVSSLVEEALSFAGLFLIPGLVGGAIVGEYLLRIYGNEFTKGTLILVVLIVACLVQSYQKQVLNTLNAIDRPDIAFRVNAVFVVSNVILNVTLIYLYGWLGAAVATVLSIAISLVLGYRQLRSLVEFGLPVLEILRQTVAAGAMGVTLYAFITVEPVPRILRRNLPLVVVVIAVGAGIYFAVLLAISSNFRSTVANNLPVRVPL